MSLILTVNAGSSSLKFAVFQAEAELKRLISGQFSRIGLSDPRSELTDLRSNERITHNTVPAADHAAALPLLLDALQNRIELKDLRAVGHRLVHGGPRYADPTRITDELIAELERIQLFAPEHLPAEIALVRALAQRHPGWTQVACFDTGFHQHLPSVARLLPIPRRYFTQGIRRYGFHGLSYQYLMRQLENTDPRAAQGRVILAHLGNGASMAAVRNGQSIDTTMAFTPTSGLVMSTRTGDLDPGLVAYIARAENRSTDDWYHMLHAESGLIGVSETSSDMRDLLAREPGDPRAADAIALFCQQAKKTIGAYAAVLGGLDTLVFAGGIGENAPILRARICENLEFLGLALDPARNAANEPVISRDGAPVTVRRIPTDEETEMARLTARLVL